MLQWWLVLIIGIICIIGGIVAGFFIARAIFAKQMEKNPPITREQIKMMYMQMGRKPTEKDINKIMETMKPKS